MEAALLWFCNWSTLAMCAALKLPQIHAQLAARSARGVSLPSLLLELAGFLVFVRYQCYYGSPVLTYLEFPILIVQDVVLLLCVFHFNGDIKRAAPYLAVFVSSWFVLGLHKGVIDLAMNLSTLVSVASKLAQLQYLWKVQDSGTASALTWGLSAYTSAARIVTTLMTSGDLAVLSRFVIMMVLNIWVTVTVLRYRKPASKAE
ncbi:solute carrier family 66 member 3 [Cavia porcellus]|uniref:Solute carrier family 66 member 3 n=1 Tax=Cavia porcellus TaxID=10141 RepID=A0A286XG12_CAVPO|nr:PQ-loop repeat-containing protein 3 [Cavia porcellus]